MIRKILYLLALFGFMILAWSGEVVSAAVASPLKLDERPMRSGEWGYRPDDQATSELDPPGFVWRPQKKIVRWELEIGRSSVGQSSAGQGSASDAAFQSPVYQTQDVEYNAHCPTHTLGPGEYVWRYRGFSAAGDPTAWSQVRRFTISSDATTFPIPPKDELLSRIPKGHPRLFLRPEQLESLRQECQGKRKEDYDRLIKICEQFLAHPPSTEEPPTYPKGTVRLSEEWREIWWGNRIKTEKPLSAAVHLALGWTLSGNEKYGQEAKRILMEVAKWDPHGATGYRYNDEAGMPYAYHFSRTYTLLHDLLTEREREVCRRVMRQRGKEMYHHLRSSRHLWTPYGSHRNRAWHYLGEIGIAFHGEIPEAEDWTWYAVHIFRNSYPVWSDSDGGWHEGLGYWSSYVYRFSWWGDVMRVALGLDAYQKPFFAKAGYFPMYVAPPGKKRLGFGDCTVQLVSKKMLPVVYQLATQAGNGHWMWYVDHHLKDLSEQQRKDRYLRFSSHLTRFSRRAMEDQIEQTPPTDLPTSRVFRGIGLAALNTTLLDAKDDVQVLFKSAPVPFGTYSHGFEASNSFLLWAYGQPLFIRSGKRDIYGSDHHKNWMWSTRAMNNITVDGQGQARHAGWTGGEITAFKTTPWVDVVTGSAADAYRGNTKSPSLLDRYTRTIIFVKPELVVVYDQLKAKKLSTFNYRLHTFEPLAINTDGGKQNLELEVGDVGCTIQMLRPQGLKFTQTDKCDPPPWPKIKLHEFHLKADTPQKQKSTEFITLFRPHRLSKPGPRGVTLTEEDACYRLKAETIDGPNGGTPNGGTVEIRLPKHGATDGSLIIEKGDKRIEM